MSTPRKANTGTLALSQLRNVGIVAHVDAGKTTLTERLLYFSGRIHHLGEVHRGDTAMDDTPEEQKHGITIRAAATTLPWTVREGVLAGVAHTISLLDTPGHVDFTLEVERALRVLDGAVVVLDAVRGVEPQTETVWRQARRHRVPCILFANKMDRPGADLALVLRTVRERLGVRAVPVQLPLGAGADGTLGDEHAGVVDLLTLRAARFDERGAYAWGPIPEALVAPAHAARATLIEACAEHDEALMSEWLERGLDAVSAASIERALRAATLSHALVPVLCGSAYRNKGVQPLLDAICAYLPRPTDAPPLVGTDPATGTELVRERSTEAPACALAFKVQHHGPAGALTFVRVYAGVISRGASLLEPRTGRAHRMGRLLRMHASRSEEISEARAGDVVAVQGLDVRAGDTLCAPLHPIVLEALSLPEPVLELVVEPKKNADRDRVIAGLSRLVVEDPSLRLRTDAEHAELRLAGMGELHLAIALERLASSYGVEARAGRPSVSYRETLAGEARVDYRLKKQRGGPGLFADLSLHVAPGPRGSGLVLEDRIAGGAVPRELVLAVHRGVEGALSRGIAHGHPVVDVAVTLLDGATHPRDSTPVAFELAGAEAWKEASRLAGARLLEPIMRVEARAPEAQAGAILGDAASRRGRVLAIEPLDAHTTCVIFEAPLAELFGYVGALRGLTQGRGDASMRFDRLELAPEPARARVA